MKIVCTIESNYVTNRKVVDDNYQLKAGEVFDVNENIYIGDWYEESEGRFMRYVHAAQDGLPEDAPETLRSVFTKEQG